jgi:phosphopentomutase
MPRCFILVLDSLGIGAASDARAYGDEGSNTLGHIAEWRALSGQELHIPHLERLGLGAASHLATGFWPRGLHLRQGFTGAYAAANERSLGKDTSSGHWEMMGYPVDFEWGYFPKANPCFPAEFMAAWTQACGLAGVLGNTHASGTEILARLGDEHMLTGWPIAYTSADSVFQVAAHEHVIPLSRLYDLCQVAFELLKPHRIARVIARPFVGAHGQYLRTPHRRDFAVAPPGITLLDVAAEAGREVIALGKIGDIFAHRGIGQLIKATSNMTMFDRLLEQVHTAPNGAIVFANFVDFDQEFGHRRDVPGYAHALEAFDARLPSFMDLLQPDDLVAFTADHGCDPTWPGTDHTREHVPQLFAGPKVEPGPLGVRASFCDLGQTVAAHLGLPALPYGTSLLNRAS